MSENTHEEAVAELADFMMTHASSKSLKLAATSDAKRHTEARRFLRQHGDDAELARLMTPLVNPGSRSDRMKESALMDAQLHIARQRGWETTEPATPVRTWNNRFALAGVA